MKIVKKISSFFIIFSIIFTFSACETPKFLRQNPLEKADGSYERSVLYVWFVDVGQADCTLVRCGGETMLIDGGNRSDGPLVADYLQSLGVEKIDLLVNTHAHEDHLGGLPDVIGAIPVERALLSSAGYDSAYGADLLAALKGQNVPYDTAAAGETFMLGGADVQVVGPVSQSGEDLNNTSIVLRLTYNGRSFLFTGDASQEEEKEILASGCPLQADVLRAGHHGSATASSYVFLREVLPSFVVISVGAGNSYGLPSEETLSRCRDVGAAVYRTDESGTVLATVDGQGTLAFDFLDTQTDGASENSAESPNDKTSAAAPDGTDRIIGNKNSMVCHAPDCAALPKAERRVYFATLSDALAAGYRPHSTCVP